jgi:hypothetical protein
VINVYATYMVVVLYSSSSTEFLQLIPFYLCAKCGRLVRFNEICECELIFNDLQYMKKRGDYEDNDDEFEKSDKAELLTPSEIGESSAPPGAAIALC